MLKIIAGERRGTNLKTLQGKSTRPLRSRVRESLFNMIQFEVRGTRVLDLFAGSGAVGLEALSRGAAYCLFVEAGAKACRVIMENTSKLRYEDRSELLQGELPKAIDQLPDSETAYDFVFVTAPYDLKLTAPVLERLAEAAYVTSETKVVVEISSREETPVDEKGPWEIEKDREYGVTRLLFLRKR